MGIDFSARRIARAAVCANALVLSSVLTGCVSSTDELASDTAPSGAANSATNQIVANITTSGKGPIEVDQSAFLSQVFCPRAELQTGTFLIMKYARGKENDPRGLLYQAYIDEWARECSREGTDQTRVKLGLSGHVTPGPAWKGGEVTLPVRVAVLPLTTDPEPLSSEIFTIPVTVGEGAPSETWKMIESSFVVPRDTNVRLVFGFDEGKKSRR